MDICAKTGLVQEQLFGDQREKHFSGKGNSYGHRPEVIEAGVFDGKWS